MALTEEDLPVPKFEKRISAHEILLGPVVQPLDRLRMFSEDEFEEITLYWAFGYLSAKYKKVRHLGGRGDKGRDIICYCADGSTEIYQCKHYGTKITPTNIYVELGKLFYYTYNNHFKLPKQYFIVSPLGVGPDLRDLLDNPNDFKNALLTKWDTYCRDKITKQAKVELSIDFKAYIEKIDFSIIQDIAPHEFISQFEETKYYASWFGGGLKKFRKVIPSPNPEIQNRELNYVTQLFDVYSEKLGLHIQTPLDLERANGELLNHFKDQRSSFYCAESLEQFSRDNFPDAELRPFDELKTDTYTLISDVLLLYEKAPGFDRLLHSIMKAKGYAYNSNPLHAELKPHDKAGICHHLANENIVQWMKKP